ncbi:Lrp/AsnC family transcriptional regulator [Seohaeicola nanhaiensis]|uniref:Lrp/AsnC family transcriptional regulator n=1 Tax=Seohaeicola nanhaiensis TaxID=1387282 RepID=A0ABV9KAS1_9RHOB
MPDLDPVDAEILRHLRRDSRMSNADLAERVGLSPSSCWRRVRALEEGGVIKRYSVVLDGEKIGQAFQAIVHVQLTRHDPQNVEGFIRAVQGKEEVRDCFATTGQSDYHLFVSCADLNAYNRFLEGFLFRLPAVASAQTNMVLRTIKARD